MDTTDTDPLVLLQYLSADLDQNSCKIQELEKALERKEEENRNLQKTIRQLSGKLAQVQSKLHNERKERSELQNKYENEWKRSESFEQKSANFERLVLSAMEISSGDSSPLQNEKLKEMFRGAIKPVDLISKHPLEMREALGTSSSSQIAPPYIQNGTVASIEEEIMQPNEVTQVKANLKRKLEEKAKTVEDKVALKRNHVEKLSTEVTPNPCSGLGAVSVYSSPVPTSTSAVLPSLSPLVFQFQSSQLKMGMLIDGEPELLKNSFGSYTTPFVVGVTPDGNLEYGNGVNLETDHSNPTISKYIWVTDQLIKCGDDPWSSEILRKDGGRQKINVEFLIAFILRNLKEDVEAKLKGTCGIALITIPFWYSSAHRIQVKDGARLAGFTEVYLVNEGSAAVFASAAARDENLVLLKNILVLSENGGQIDASIYSLNSYTSGCKRLSMIGHGSHYMEMDRKVIKSFQVEEMERIVDKICNQAILSMHDKKYNIVGDTSPPAELIIIAESNQWKKILNQVGQQFVSPILDSSSESDVVFGAAHLSRDRTQIAKIISDKLAYDVFVALAMYDGGGSILQVIPKGDKVVRQTLPSQCKLARVFQIVGGRPIGIAGMTVHSSVRPDQRLTLNLGITNEGIIKPLAVAIASPWHGILKANKQHYSWKTPNLSEEDFTATQALLESIFKDGVTPEGRVKEAKRMLLQLCNELKKQLDGGILTINSKLIRDALVKTIMSALGKAELANISTEEIHGQMKILEKWRSKYIK